MTAAGWAALSAIVGALALAASTVAVAWIRPTSTAVRATAVDVGEVKVKAREAITAAKSAGGAHPRGGE